MAPAGFILNAFNPNESNRRIRVAHVVACDLRCVTHFTDTRVPMVLFGSSSSGTTAWFGAARGGNLAEIENGLARGIKVDAKSTEHSRTALWLASAGGHASVVTRLIEANARLDYHDVGLDNDTALHIAAYKGHAEVVRILIAAGAAPHVKNANGRTARDLTAVNGSNVSAKTLDAIRASLEGRSGTGVQPSQETVPQAVADEQEEQEGVSCGGASPTTNRAALARARASRRSSGSPEPMRSSGPPKEEQPRA